jgi:hypothetical protein
MTITNKTITKGFIIAGLMNSTVLIFSRFFTNETISEFDTAVMSKFGLLMILVWGLAYIAVAKQFENVKWLVGVFAVEKFIYGCRWIDWIANNTLSSVFEKDKMAGLFYASYGINDWLFFIFFTLIFIKLVARTNQTTVA